MKYSKPTKNNGRLESVEIYEGESIETKCARVLESGEPIADTAPIIYTEKEDGVLPAYNIRTGRFDIASTIWVIVLYMVINISISNILEPKLMGKELGLSPLVIFFSLIFWGYILGIVGMFLAVPITMTLKIAFDSNSNSRWLGILMSDLSRKKLKRRV